ncbi:MAG: hypothetical protein U1F33_17995 [Alphaproteobacteria bacterium]
MAAIPYLPPGVTYNGLHATTNPTPAAVAADLATTKAHFQDVRVYYPQYGGGAVDVGKATRAAGLGVLLALFPFPGHDDWTAENYAAFVKPAVAGSNVRALLVGNEDPEMLATIATYLGRAKADFPALPRGTAQTSAFWLTDGRAASLLPLVDFIAVNLYPGWDWALADANNQPIGVTPESGFASFLATYQAIATKYPGHQIVVTETGWPTTYGLPSAKQFPIGIANARDYLNRVIAWAGTTKTVVYIHNMFDDQYGIDPRSAFNGHFGLIDGTNKPKGVLF